MREQCLVRDAGDRLHPVVAVGHEQPRIDQDVDKPPADGIDSQRLQRHAARHDRLVISLTGGDERAQKRRQRVLNLGRESGERRLGMVGQRTFQAPERAVGLAGQHAAVAVAKQLVERELQERQRLGVAQAASWSMSSRAWPGWSGSFPQRRAASCAG